MGAKRIYIGHQDVTYKDPTKADWEQLQKILGRTLPDDLRIQLAFFTWSLASFGSSAKQTITTRKLIKELQLWEKRTRILRKSLSTKPSEELSTIESEGTRAEVIKAFFQKGKMPLFGTFHVTHLLTSSIDSALAASGLLIREISDPQYDNTWDQALWYAWIGIIQKLMNEHGLSVYKLRGSTKVMDPQFVKFVEALRDTLPPGDRRRNQPQSLKKGIQEALHIFSDNSLATVFFLMVFWSLNIGDINFLRTLSSSPVNPLSREIAAVLQSYESLLMRRREQRNPRNRSDKKIA